jgi:uncharacterized protein (TIGR02145 family)
MDTSLEFYWYPGQDANIAPAIADDILEAHPEYGLLYTWAAASGRTDHKEEETNNSTQQQYQGICPTSWHLPSDYEWNQLEKEIAESAAGIYSISDAATWETSYSDQRDAVRGTHGQKMKSTTAVNIQDNDGTSKSHSDGGFDALLVSVIMDDSALNYGTTTAFWSSSSFDRTTAWRRNVYYDIAGVYRNPSYRVHMRSVRCKKN